MGVSATARVDPLLRRSLAVLLAIALGVGLAVWRSDDTPHPTAADTFQYAWLAYGVAGDGTPRAELAAQHFVCHTAPALYPGTHCRNGHTTWRVNRKYADIFAGRLAYPVLVAAFLPLAGRLAFAVATTLLAAACGLAAFWWLRTLGLSTLGALAAEALVLLLPGDQWITSYLPEGAMLAGTFVALAGATLAIGRGRPRLGLPVLAAGLAWTIASKEANGLAAGCAIAAGALVVGVGSRRLRRAAAEVVAVALGMVGTFLAVSRLAGVDGLRQSLEDTFTDHFQRAPVGNPWQRLFDQQSLVVNPYLHHFLDQRYPVVIAAVIAGVLVWRLRWLAVFPMAVAATGLAIIVLHPVGSEFPRLELPVWVAVMAAGAVVADLLLRAAVRPVAARRRPSW